MRMESHQHDFRRKTAAIVLAYNAPGKTGDKDGVDASLPVLQIGNTDVRTEGPGHLDREADPLETGASCLFDKIFDLTRFFFCGKLARLTPLLTGPKLQRAAIHFLTDID